MASLDTRNFTRQKLPGSSSFLPILEATLPRWDMSLVFVGETRAKNLNRALRGKDYTPNVLSYETGPESGEILICPKVAARQAKEYGMKTSEFLLFLFIHGCLHLKGLPHGTTMEKRERALFARFVTTPFPNQWHDASQRASISERTKRKSSSSKRSTPTKGAFSK